MAILGIGRYVVRGIAGTVNYTALVAANNKISALTYKKSFGVTEHRDGMGSVYAVTAGEPVEEIQVTLTPIAQTGATNITDAQSKVAVPGPLDPITIAGMPGSISNATTWVYVDGDIRLSTDGTPEIQCTLRKYVDTVVSGTPANFS
mgnify:FL=1